MCTFITLVAASGDLDQVNTVLAAMDRRGYARRAERVETPCLRVHLAPGEREYWLIHPPRDCNTFLGARDPDYRPPRRDPDTRAGIWRRKGWSEAKIARALADVRGVQAKRPPRTTDEDAAYWIDTMHGLCEGLGVVRLGLMHRFYDTAPGVEDFEAGRMAGGTIDAAAPVLGRMPRGVIHDFARA